MYFKASKTVLVEVIIPATAVSPGRFPFTDQPFLRTDNEKTVIIDAIENFSNQALAISPISTQPVSPVAAIANAVLTLNVEGFEDFQSIPLASLGRVNSDTGATFVPFVNDLFAFNEVKRINWQKSYIQLVAAPVAPPFSYLFQVYYRVFPAANAPSTFGKPRQ
jgi:hypothetical protein